MLRLESLALKMVRVHSMVGVETKVSLVISCEHGTCSKLEGFSIATMQVQITACDLNRWRESR